MRNTVEIDHRHSRAIAQEIGERLRVALVEDSELPPNLRFLIERLRELDDLSGAHRFWPENPKGRRRLQSREEENNDRRFRSYSRDGQRWDLRRARAGRLSGWLMDNVDRAGRRGPCE